jgi:hypothetical protein
VGESLYPLRKSVLEGEERMLIILLNRVTLRIKKATSRKVSVVDELKRNK